MKRTNIIIGFLSYALLALILIVCGWMLAALLLLLIYGIVLLLYKRNKKAQWLIDGDPSDKETLDTLIEQYGQPDDVVVIDASRANEPFGVILIYSSGRFLIAAGKRIPFDSITGISSKNSATPYTVGQFQILINTNDKQLGSLHLNAGYDAQFATEAATQVLHALKKKSLFL